MDFRVAEVIDEYEIRYRREFGEILPQMNKDEIRDIRDQLLMSVGPDTGLFINAMLKAARPRTVLELGTSYGHSTIYLAEAAKATGSMVFSCDIDGEKQVFAEKMLRKADLHRFVTFIQGDAVDVVGTMDEIDFCLIDLWNEAYIPAFDAVHPRLSPAAYVIADNMTVPDRAAGDRYRRHVRHAADMDSVLLPIGWGLEVSQRRAAPAAAP